MQAIHFSGGFTPTWQANLLSAARNSSTFSPSWSCYVTNCSNAMNTSTVNAVVRGCLISLISALYWVADTQRESTCQSQRRMHFTLSSYANSQIIFTRLSHSIIGLSDAAPPNPGINRRSKGLLAIAAGFRKSVTQHLRFAEIACVGMCHETKKKKSHLSYCRSNVQSQHLLEYLSPTLIPALYTVLGNSPKQNTTHLHRQASYQSQFLCLSTSTCLEGVKLTKLIHYSQHDLMYEI